jgi:hypothetical protein
VIGFTSTRSIRNSHCKPFTQLKVLREKFKEDLDRQREDEEMGNCTFKPEITQMARNMKNFT